MAMTKEDFMLEELTLRKAVEFAVKTERLGQVFYRKLAAEFTGDPELKEAFTLLAEDEAAHEQRFRELEDEVSDEAAPRDDERYRFLRAMSISEFFTGDEGLYRDLEAIKDENDALMRAFALEKATLQYYQAMQDAMGSSDVLDAIIEAEKSHIVKLMSYLLTDAKFRGISDDF
jgi:rubrerythrin